MLLRFGFIFCVLCFLFFFLLRFCLNFEFFFSFFRVWRRLNQVDFENDMEQLFKIRFVFIWRVDWNRYLIFLNFWNLIELSILVVMKLCFENVLFFFPNWFWMFCFCFLIDCFFFIVSFFWSTWLLVLFLIWVIVAQISPVQFMFGFSAVSLHWKGFLFLCELKFFPSCLFGFSCDLSFRLSSNFFFSCDCSHCLLWKIVDIRTKLWVENLVHQDWKVFKKSYIAAIRAEKL